MTSYHVDKPNFLEFWVKMAKMTLKVGVNDLYFQHQSRVSHGACLVQIWWFQLKSVRTYRVDKVKFTDGQTDGRPDRWTNAGNDNTHSTQKAKGKNSNLCANWSVTTPRDRPNCRQSAPLHKDPSGFLAFHQERHLIVTWSPAAPSRRRLIVNAAITASFDSPWDSIELLERNRCSFRRLIDI